MWIGLELFLTCDLVRGVYVVFCPFLGWMLRSFCLPRPWPTIRVLRLYQTAWIAFHTWARPTDQNTRPSGASGRQRRLFVVAVSLAHVNIGLGANEHAHQIGCESAAWTHCHASYRLA